MSSSIDARDGAKILEESAGVRLLSGVSVLTVSGDDARSWLNGQLTNDVRETTSGRAVYALAVTVKGKILADVWVYDRGEDRFWLAVPEPSVTSLLESFDKQIIMEDVEVARDGDVAVIAVAGPKAAEVAAAVEGRARVYETERLGTSRDVLATADVEALFAQLVAEAERLGGGAIPDASWELARIRRSTPRYPVDFDGRNYPQEAGLKERAVSFDKGCYLGQEVVCMLESRGKVSKRLVTLELAGDQLPDAESEIVADEGKTVGHLRSSVVEGDHTLAFGYVKAAFAEVGRALAVDERPARVTGVVD